MGWFSTVLKVVNTTSNILSKFAEGDNYEDIPNVVTQIGLLKFRYSQVNGTQVAEVINTSTEYDFMAYFSRVTADGKLESGRVHVGKKGSTTPKDVVTVTEYMKRFSDGIITYAPYKISSSPEKANVSFTAEYILKEQTIFVPNPPAETATATTAQYYLDYNETGPNKWSISFIGAHKFENFEITFTDRNGVNFYLHDSFISKIGESWQALVTMPEGSNQHLPFRDVKVQFNLADPQDIEDYMLSVHGEMDSSNLQPPLIDVNICQQDDVVVARGQTRQRPGEDRVMQVLINEGIYALEVDHVYEVGGGALYNCTHINADTMSATFRQPDPID